MSKTELKARVSRTAKHSLRAVGYDDRNWLRIKQITEFENFLSRDSRCNRRVLEISPGRNPYWRNLCTNYWAVGYPEFDICTDTLPETFHVVIADQVLEHVKRPIAAVKNIYAMTEPGGWAMVATPFLFRVHARPFDFNRWTPPGLKQLLVEGGFEEQNVQAFGWGNKACARAHIGGAIRDYGFYRDMHNDDEYPCMVWAFAQK